MKGLTILSIFCLLAAGLFVPVAGCDEKNDTASIFSVSGDVKVIRMGSNIGLQCEEGMNIKPGDWIKTGEGSSATLSFDNSADNIIKVQENSLVVMKLDGYFKVQLLDGKINAILESVQQEETFRVLTPSVVTESTNSGWALSADGNYSTVVVVDGEAYVCGINEDGSIRKSKFAVQEGYGRTTKMYQDPADLTAAPESVMKWFKDQVLEHHLAKVMAKKAEEKGVPLARESERQEPEDAPEEFQPKVKQRSERREGTKGKNVAIIDGEEVSLLEYIYRKRLEQEEGR
ncbi:MAG: FecR domain-containing protein [Candidatus Omnitrophota bacterium]